MPNDVLIETSFSMACMCKDPARQVNAKNGYPLRDTLRTFHRTRRIMGRTVFVAFINAELLLRTRKSVTNTEVRLQIQIFCVGRTDYVAVILHC